MLMTTMVTLSRMSRISLSSVTGSAHAVAAMMGSAHDQEFAIQPRAMTASTTAPKNETEMNPQVLRGYGQDIPEQDVVPVDV
ncbi:MAG: hypothetical protein KIS91_10945 [Anaerolineae bacterium]|nr:hypothetical protein [Anaerolineae bacterium]